jgi:hypothetical protein
VGLYSDQTLVLIAITCLCTSCAHSFSRWFENTNKIRHYPHRHRHGKGEHVLSHRQTPALKVIHWFYRTNTAKEDISLSVSFFRHTDY